jgi:hypothetical protein
MGDDYVFLDKTRNATFAQLWSLKNTNFGWYRPWSREFHFWVLERVAGLHEAVYRSASLVLWLAVLSLYAAIVRRLTSTRVAMLATAGVAGLALWGTPLLWISGSQDLWMLCFALSSLLLFMRGQVNWALLVFGLALLSKETSAVLPGILFSYATLIERRAVSLALKRTAGSWILLLVWFLIHPTLHARLLSPGARIGELATRPPLHVMLLKIVLSAVNLDLVPHPRDIGPGDVVRFVVSGVALVSIAVFAFHSPKLSGEQSSSSRQSVVRLALAWMACGWFPLVLPSIGWHAYYGCFGALGAWLLLAVWLERTPRLALVVVAALAILRSAHASTLSWDWGNEWYQRRAGSILGAIRTSLQQRHPTLPHYSRVFFGHIPNNIGLVAGNSPAIRVWYSDSTLQANFYSAYRPRSVFEPHGEDLFFHFDSLAGIIEVRAGPENVSLDMASDPDWEGNHEALAMLFMQSGDVPRAAVEFEKLAVLPRRPDAAVYAGVCREAMGDSAGAESLFRAAQGRLGLTPLQMDVWVGQLRATFPGR